jgi:hypothetical protein
VRENARGLGTFGFSWKYRGSPVCAAFSWISPWRIVWIPLESFVRNERFQCVTSESSRRNISGASSYSTIVICPKRRQPSDNRNSMPFHRHEGIVAIILIFSKEFVDRVSVADDMSGLGSARSVR